MQADDLKSFRERRGLSQADFAAWLNDRLGRKYDRQRISRWETGGEKIPTAVARLLLDEVVAAPTERHGPALVSSVSLQKGGVGKTTTSVNAASILALEGYRVLLIDADPQASATLHLGFDPIGLQASGRTIDNAFRDGVPIADVIVTVEHSGLDLVPSSIRLSKTEAELMSRPASNFILKKLMMAVRSDYDFVFIDTPPHLSQMTLNALTAADTVLIPCQTEVLAVAGVEYLLDTINEIRELCHPTLQVLGILPTMYNSRLTQDRESLREMHERYAASLRVFEPVPRATVYGQSVAAGRAAVEAIPDAAGAGAFRAVVDALVTERTRRFGSTQEVAHVA
ncbi:AAA family ATPase [Azospirillum sp.]|uniref:AAA family ATPase n=1 Tax=Azospirillum sp. TaxID=34012 RepID=UPI003D7483E7